jgi:peptide/nickel transport system permease protein
VIPTLVGVAIAVFFLIRVMPGDVVVVKLRADGRPYQRRRSRPSASGLGLDKPLTSSSSTTWSGLPRLGPRQVAVDRRAGHQGDRAQDARLLPDRHSWPGVIAVLIAIPLGTISALYRDTWVDHTVRVVAVSGLAIPSFWLGMLTILALLSLFNWLPKIGYVPLWEDPITNLSVTIWPAASVGYRYAAVATRMMRSSLLEVMREDYIRTARAKGVWTRLIMSRHALRNALLPVVTVIGLEFAFLIGGLVVTEQVFNINGIGKLFVDATARGDFNLIQGLVLLIATIFIFVNLLVDLLYGWLDPRIRLT